MNAAQLLSQIRTDGALPSTNGLSDQVLIDRLNDELGSIVAVILEASKQDFFTDVQDTPLVSTRLAYPFPERAIANTARVVKWVDSSGAESSDPLEQVALADVGDFSTGGSPQGFYLTATDINPLPRPDSSTSGLLRIYYARKPSKLVLDLVDGSARHTQVGTIANIAVAGGNSTITLAAAHSGFPAGQNIDIQAARSPYKLLTKDVAVTAAAVGLTIVCNGVDLTTIGWSVGDYVTLARTSFIPMLPEEAHSMLRDFAIARNLTVVSLNRANSIKSEAMDRLKVFLKVAEPRMNQNAKPISAWRGWRRGYRC